MTELLVNGRLTRVGSAAGVPLLDVLRDELGLRGTRAGCREGVCGACRVLLDDRLVAACQTPLEAACGHEVGTVEAVPAVLREAFEAEQAAQCGYCSSGMLVAAAALLREVDDPSPARIREALQAQQCRCGAHPRIVRAVRRAAVANRATYAEQPGEPRACATGPVSAGPRELPAALRRQPQPARWLAVWPDGTLEVRSGKVEIGQGIQRALALLVAQELGWPLERVRVPHASTATHPDEGVTSGSLSVQDSGTVLRCVAAAVRQRLCTRAASAWGVDAARVDLIDGELRAPTGRREPALVWIDRMTLEDPVTPEEGTAWRTVRPAPAEAEHWHASLTRRAVFAGEPHFIQDLQLPGLLQGAVLHPPGQRDRLTAAAHHALPAALGQASQRPGMLEAWRDGELIGLLGEQLDGVRRARQGLQAALGWEPREVPGLASTVAHRWPETVSAARVVDERHPPSAAPARTARRLQARYTRPWLAHASIGPSCALARWAADGGEQPLRLEVWTHSQGIFGLRRDLALAFGLAEAEVRVQHVPGAGCYGHNGADDVAFDAAWLARRVPGRPVRCEWSRADDLARAPLGPAMCVELSAEVDEAGCVRHWQHELWSPGHSSRPGRSSTPALLGHAQRDGGAPLPDPIDMPLEVGGGAERNAIPGYAFEAWRIVAHRVRAPWRSSALRSLGALGNVFAAESFVDEVARATGRDPLAWRDELLAHDPRGQAVLRAVAALAGWNTDVAGEAAPGATRAGQPGEIVETAEAVGRGIGYARYKLTGAWCAVVAEVEVGATLVVRRLVIAADIGHVVDAEGASMQLEGAAIQATGFALKEAVEPGEDGRLPPDQADSVPMLGFTEVPEVEVLLLPSPAPSLGAGEAAVGPTVAAIANALTDALGVRVRDLPLTRARIVAAIQEQEG